MHTVGIPLTYKSKLRVSSTCIRVRRSNHGPKVPHLASALSLGQESSERVLHEQHHVREVHHHAGLEVGHRDILGLAFAHQKWGGGVRRNGRGNRGWGGVCQTREGAFTNYHAIITTITVVLTLLFDSEPVRVYQQYENTEISHRSREKVYSVFSLRHRHSGLPMPMERLRREFLSTSI